PEFLPWCLAARVRERSATAITADLLIGFRMVRERFTSRVVLDRPNRIDVSYSKGPLRYLNNHWEFIAQADGGCLIDFYVDFEFRSRLLQKVIEMLFNEAVRRMVSAFEARARALYGTAPTEAAMKPV
ncbi:MAG TPA: type II toxin-antitoxin system RatA family toxin, partial [Stellaceae bacterium]|nr:type II toxin-antitoxin system RatA family toxin [Stellaceae bacterium]